MNKRIWLALIAAPIFVPGVLVAVAQITGPESRTGVAPPVSGPQLHGQSMLLTAADAAAKVASAREARPQAAVPGAKTGGTFYEVQFPGAFQTGLEGINPQGDIVWFYFDNSGGAHGFLLREGTYTTIEVPEALGASPGSTQASAINPQGDILGEYWDSSHNEHGFLLSRKGIFRTIDVPGSINTFPLGMDPQGDILGTSFEVPAFLLSHGTVTTIDVPGSSFTVPYAINPQRDIVGLYFDIDNNLHGFVRKP